MSFNKSHNKNYDFYCISRHDIYINLIFIIFFIIINKINYQT